MVKRKKSVILAVKEDDIKGSQLKLLVARKHMKNINMVMKAEDASEYENLFTALNVNVNLIERK